MNEGTYLNEGAYSNVQHRDGIPWYAAPAPPRRHTHRWQTRGYAGPFLVQRCACGAISDAGGWGLFPGDEPRVAPAPWWKVWQR